MKLDEFKRQLRLNSTFCSILLHQRYPRQIFIDLTNHYKKQLSR